MLHETTRNKHETELCFVRFRVISWIKSSSFADIELTLFKSECFLLLLVLHLLSVSHAVAQQNAAPSPTATPAVESKKTNRRPALNDAKTEPFDKATVKEMAAQCVKLETEAGLIEIELLPEAAPESVRNFLNLAATGAFDTTTFSRVVKDFVVQGGNLSTREKLTPELAERARRIVPDEPNYVKHVRGIVSMARPDTPNGATTNFFILVSDAPHLDGTFAAFGRVTGGMEVADAINRAPVENEKPNKPVRLLRASVQTCATK